MMKIIYSDLDGTLLDSDTYSYGDAFDALKLVKKFSIPLVFCTSKTRAEIEFWRGKLENKDPFISENGGGIFIPKDYFSFSYDYDFENEKYFVIELGTKYSELVNVLNILKEKYEILGFSDMSSEQISQDANLELTQAKLAKKREFDLPFKIVKKVQEKEILGEINKYKLKCIIGGRYYHLMGDNNKGKAVEMLSTLFKRKFGDIKTIAIGDSENDFHMLDIVDEGYLVQKKNQSYASSNYKKANGVGPVGWNNVIKKEVFS